MLSIRLICVGKLKEQFYTDAANEYIKRLSGYCKLEIIEVPEYRLPPGSAVVNSKPGIRNSETKNNFSIKTQRSAEITPESSQDYVSREPVQQDSRIVSALNKERAVIEAKIPEGSVCVALCIEGREMDSPDLSGFLNDCAIRGLSRLCFIIGGSFGLHEDVKKRAAVKLSMSKMTFPHNLARVMLLEQLYRAFKIIEGGNYHK